jgi:hypothetical protein
LKKGEVRALFEPQRKHLLLCGLGLNCPAHWVFTAVSLSKRGSKKSNTNKNAKSKTKKSFFLLSRAKKGLGGKFGPKVLGKKKEPRVGELNPGLRGESAPF